MRLKPVCESRHRAEVALELRNSFGFWQNLRVRGFLINLVLLCHPVFLLLSVEDLPLLVSGLAQLLLLEVSISEMLGGFHTTDINFGRGGDDEFMVLLCRGARLRARSSVTSSKPLPGCFRHTTLLLLWRPGG